MTDKPKKWSNAARTLLTVAAQRNDHLIAPPKLPAAAARQVARSLLNAGFAEEVPAPLNDPGYAWRTGEDGGVLALRATELGLARVGERDAWAPAPEPIAAEAWGTTTGADAGAGVVEPTALAKGLASPRAWPHTAPSRPRTA